jgi:hypothetical protein
MATSDITTRPVLSHDELSLIYVYRQLPVEERKLFLAAATCDDEQQRRAYMQQLSPLSLDIIISTLKPQSAQA